MSDFDLMTLLGEFLGTMFLIILGNGVCYATSHSRMFANQKGNKWILIALGWGFAVMIGVIASAAFKAPGHLNPAVTVYDVIKTQNVWPLLYIPMQFLGAMVGQLILNFINWKHIMATAMEDTSATRGAHATGPAFDNKNERSTIFNVGYEFVGTFILIFVVYAFGKINTTPAVDTYVEFLGPLPIAFVIMSLGISLGSSTGYALNPARDLGPRIVYALSRKMFSNKAGVELADANWSYSWVPVVGPILAGLVMGGISYI